MSEYETYKVKNFEQFLKILNEKNPLSEDVAKTYWSRMIEGWDFFVEILDSGDSIEYVGKIETIKKGVIFFSKTYNVDLGKIKDESVYADRILFQIIKE
jgi:hypothetical protein